MDVLPGPTALGQLVVRRGLLTEEQLELAVAEHLASERPLVEILVERGYLDEQQLASVLDEHRTVSPVPLETLRAQLAATQAEAARDVPRAELRPVPDPVDGFVLFVPTPGGYRLLERSGEQPLVGESVGISGGELVVVKVGASPLPGDRRPCVFLQEG